MPKAWVEFQLVLLIFRLTPCSTRFKPVTKLQGKFEGSSCNTSGSHLTSSQSQPPMCFQNSPTQEPPSSLTDHFPRIFFFFFFFAGGLGTEGWERLLFSTTTGFDSYEKSILFPGTNSYIINIGIQS